MKDERREAVVRQGEADCQHPNAGAGPCERCVARKQGVATLMRQWGALGAPERGPELDDVLDLYSLMSEEAGKDMLFDLVKLFPQFETELRQFAAFKAIGRFADAGNF